MNDIVTISLGLATFLLTVFALIQTNRFNRFQKKVAVEQGTFLKSKLRFFFWGNEEITSYIVAVPLKEGDFIEFPLLIDLINDGDKTSENVELFYRVHKLFYPKEIATLKIKENHKIAFSENSNDDYFITNTFYIKNIHPKQRVHISLSLVIGSSTIYQNKVHAISKDNVNLVANVWMHYAVPCDCIVVQRNKEPKSRRILIRVVDTSSEDIKTILNQFNDAISKNNEKKSITSFVEWIKQLFSPIEANEKIGFITLNDKKSISKQIINNPHGEGSYSVCKIPSSAVSLYIGGEFDEGFICPSLGISFLE